MTLSCVLALTATNTAYAKNMVMPPRKHLTLEQTIKWQRKIIRHDRWVIRTRHTHNIHRVSFARKQLRWTLEELQKAIHLWQQSLFSASRSGSYSSGLPLHEKLWQCIHSHEASDWHNKDTGHNGHYGGLQMHPGWYGGSDHLASSDSKLVQENAAEAGYKASGYSRSWLMGQWYHPDCLVDA